MGRLDVGTAVLFRETEPPTARTLPRPRVRLRVIGLALAAAVPGSVVRAVDVNERAVLLAAENAAALGVADRLSAATPADVPADETYDEIWSNPPIRIGKEALHALLLTWLPRLAPGGRAVLVVGKNLGADSLQRWLGEQGWPTDAAREREGLPGAGGAAGRARGLGELREQVAAPGPSRARRPRRPAVARWPGAARWPGWARRAAGRAATTSPLR